MISFYIGMALKNMWIYASSTQSCQTRREVSFLLNSLFIQQNKIPIASLDFIAHIKTEKFERRSPWPPCGKSRHQTRVSYILKTIVKVAQGISWSASSKDLLPHGTIDENGLCVPINHPITRVLITGCRRSYHCWSDWGGTKVDWHNRRYSLHSVSLPVNLWIPFSIYIH